LITTKNDILGEEKYIKSSISLIKQNQKLNDEKKNDSSS
jgi:hypothetical protein